ncbi:Nucleoside-diphosphate-sugar epimerase [Klebsiella pneumoniae subsp. rhinoscleromatis]|nr:Nucleoside-diphosphate-sugar epimerase [Klebsiella pneumoniae subsp. rhinoscleromatis]
MKKVAIVGLGWLGMPLALSLTARGWQVTGSKTTQDGVEAARMCGIDSYPLRLEPQLVCDTEDLDALMNVDALVITLPARRTGAGEGFYLQAVQEIVDTALAYHIPRIVFTSSTSVYGNVNGTVKENSPRLPQTASGQVLKELEDWLHKPAGDIGGYSAPGRAGGAFPPSGTFFRRQVGAGWPARWSIWCICRMWWPLSNCCCRPRRAGTSIIYVRPATLRAASFIRRWPASSVCRRRCSATARTAARARL